MEWSKAKSILIFLFVVLNVFLLINILLSDSDIRLGTEYSKHVNSLLEARNIRIECPIPSYHANSGSIIYKDEDIDESRVVSFFLGHDAGDASNGEKVWEEDGKVLEIGHNSIIFKDSSPESGPDIGNKDALDGELKRILHSLGMKPGDYVQDIWYQQDGRVYVRYVRTYKGQLLFDVYADFIVSSEGLEYAVINPREVSHTIAESEILSAWQILAVSKIQENSVVSDIRFGYKQTHEGELYDSPVWRIRFKDGSAVFYNAYTGEEVSQS